MTTSRKQIFDSSVSTEDDDDDDEVNDEKRSKRETPSPQPNLWYYNDDSDDSDVVEPSFPRTYEHVSCVASRWSGVTAIKRRDKDPAFFYGYVGGMPIFMKWCFFAPWIDPKKAVESDYSWNSRERLVNMTKSEDFPPPERDDFDPRAKPNCHDRRFRADLELADRSTLLGNSWCLEHETLRHVSHLTELFVRNDGFLPAGAVFCAIDRCYDQLSANDMLRLLSFVPRANLRRHSDYELTSCLLTILRRIGKENNVSTSKTRYLETHYDDHDTLSREYEDGYTKPTTLLDSATARVWFFVRTTSFYHEIVPKMLKMPQTNVFHNIVTPEKLYVLSSGSRFHLEDSYASQSVARDIYVVLLARLSRSFQFVVSAYAL